MESKISKQKLAKYFSVTEKAFEIAQGRGKIVKGKQKQAKEIIDMAGNYIADAHFFEEKKDFVNAFAALNYAHGWLDCGVRLGIFDVDDDKLFTVR